MARFKNMPVNTILVFDKACVKYSLYRHWSKNKVSFVSRLHKRCIVDRGNLLILTDENKKIGIVEDCEVLLGHKAQKTR